jgi:ribonuclease III
MPTPLDALQQQLQYRFEDARLLERALTHRSFSANHYERLEFLGDAVLNAAVGHLLYITLTTMPEGDLSRVRANLVRQDTLHQLALSLDLPSLLRLGEGEAKSGGAARPSILADALEALIGAVYLDAGDDGFNQAAALVRRLFADVQFRPDMPALSKDPKTRLQEWLQARKLPTPGYRVLQVLGAAHKQNFEVECSVPAYGVREVAQAPSRRAGEQAAAELAMVKLLQSPPPSAATAATSATVKHRAGARSVRT